MFRTAHSDAEGVSSESEADTASGQDTVASVESEDVLILNQCDNQTCFSKEVRVKEQIM